MGLLLMEAKSFINSRQIVDCQMKLALEQMQ
jgi:hypothetical protein